MSRSARIARAVCLAGGGLALAAPFALAQTLQPGQTGVISPVAGVTGTIAPTFQTWRFAKDVPLDTLSVSGVTQVSAPFVLQIPLRAKWAASITGAVASSKLDARDSAGTVTRSLTGLSDVKVRATGPLIGDALQLTIGVNVPTGAVNLSSDQNDVIRVTAAPALNAQVPIAGTGFGGTVGLIYARFIGQWAWAFGAGVEQRGTYAPLDAQIAGIKSRTELDPGGAAHFSIGTDGLVGTSRLSMGIVTDVFGSDQLHISSGTATAVTQKYHLGPTVSGAAALEVKNSLFRELTLTLNERYRSAFKDNNDNSVDGSSGNYLDLGASGWIGAPERHAVLLGIALRQQSGLPVDKGFIGAGLTAIDATFALSIPSGALEWRPNVQFTAGSLKTALVTTGVTGVSIGLAINKR